MSSFMENRIEPQMFICQQNLVWLGKHKVHLYKSPVGDDFFAFLETLYLGVSANWV
jgi:hypothetical protein